MVQQIRWATLNDTRHVDDQDPKEVQIERCLEKYQRTLRLHQRGKLVEAKKLYNDLLENEVMRQTPLTQAPKELDVEGSATVSMATPLALLQFLVFKNYASILEEEYNNDAAKPKELAEKALDHYINALSIDPSARMLWYHTGTLARAIGNMRLAKLAFGNGLLLQSSWNTQGSDAIHPDSIIHSTPPDELAFDRFSPSQWWCLEGLCETLLKIGDHATCEYYYENVMRQLGQWKYGDTMMERIRQSKAYDGSEVQVNADNMQLDSNEIENSFISNALDLSLTRTTWADLCHVLLDQYFDIVREIPVLPFTSEHPSQNKSHLTLFVNQKIIISLDEKSNETTTVDQENEATIDQNLNNTNNMLVDMDELPTQLTKPNDSVVEDEGDDESKVNSVVPSTEAIEDNENGLDAVISEYDEMKTDVDVVIDNHKDEETSDAIQDDDQNTMENDDNIDTKHEVKATEHEAESATDTDFQNSKAEDDHKIADQPEQEPTDLNGDTSMDIDAATQSSSQVGEKRKFDEMEDENEGSDEDEGPEITRSSLRASKRERDKIEHEESTRKRVQHEEQELSNKIQEMLQATGLLPSLERTERWNQPDNADDKLRQETFSTWFEMKLSELVGTATWDLEFNIKGNEVTKKKNFELGHPVARCGPNQNRRYAFPRLCQSKSIWIVGCSLPGCSGNITTNSSEKTSLRPH
ncbi:hypothetical protein K450DRAFT_242500 [Umbelopsis ramanniana AG]|uniref:Uncharacterized protein n=1 Tax=Umbelopsis ramanniana AG TaxID=1314678 RepID=A0AAD5EBP5_UMBRA|nr:uncharacterized protein K450DRAFT_242500 [Umbelopsis ramanniana AG]KAI8579280.1 hypothetical protein K450DRAFT_242500 [Umbelopsis ramanniana AG]